MVPFVIRNRPSTKDALVRKVFQAIPERAVALTGYCYGAAMYKPLLLPKRSDEGRVKAGYIAHPSFTDAKELTALGKTIPLCLAFPEVDFRLSTKDMKDAEKGLKQEAKDAEVTFYPGVSFLPHSLGTSHDDDLHPRHCPWIRGPTIEGGHGCVYQHPQLSDQLFQETPFEIGIS